MIKEKERRKNGKG